LQVVVHEGVSEKMDFNTKNFRYAKTTVHDFIEQVKLGKRVYLRALSQAEPSDRPANLNEDFPQLAKDFELPQELAPATRYLFSSVLRISGSVNMWLHYDVSMPWKYQGSFSGEKRLSIADLV
jgi:tRNA wybutosine-synthesizing protein 4